MDGVKLDEEPRTACPQCGANTVDRLWVATWRLDVCRCRRCDSSWDEPNRPAA